MKHLILLWSLYFLLFQSVNGQFTGGMSDGFSFLQVNLPNANLYKGGNGDGFAYQTYNSTLNFQFAGNEADGFSSIEFNSFADFIYEGGASDGQDVLVYDSVLDHQYYGSTQDGFAYSPLYRIYKWTGNIGTGWNVTGNWNTNQIPSLRHPVLIPANAVNWPFVNAGVFAIGDNPQQNASYFCASVEIEHNAQLTTRVNCFVENYGLIKVNGKWFVKNPANDAFLNKTNGDLRILSIGEIRVQQ